MKIKIYTICLAAMIGSASSMKSAASTITVGVRNFVFDPADFTINSGDTIIWMWENNGGSHTTTSTNIPGGAIPWDELINSNATMFMYVPLIAGSYDYECTFHSSMVAHFTVTGSSGIADEGPLSHPGLIVATPLAGEMLLHYRIPGASKLNIQLFDIIGNKVQTVISVFQNAGSYSHPFDIQHLRSGIYMFRLETDEGSVSQRVIIP